MFGLELDTRPGDRKVANSLKNQLVQKYGLSIDFWPITPTWPVPLRGEKKLNFDHFDIIHFEH